MKRILLVEDEPAISEMIRFALAREGYEVDEAVDVKDAREMIANQRPDLAVVDWMLPDDSGVDMVRGLRQDEINRDMPVIMLTARAEENDKIVGLESGADDYMTKPVAIRELLARIRAQLRRAQGFDATETLTTGSLTIDFAAHNLEINGDPVPIGRTEFKLLHFFMSHPNRVYSRSQLLDFVWGQNVYVEERTVDVHILRLRKLLKPSGVETMVQTVRGVGYRFSVRD